MTQFTKDRNSVVKAMLTGQRKRLEIELNPDMVEWLICQRSKRQRNISTTRVNELFRLIKTYGWYPCDDFKMASHGLVNGQHRLMALRQWLQIENPSTFPTTGLIVNISPLETQLSDIGLSRTRIQRLKMMTGEDFNHNRVSAVVFELSYPNLTDGRKVLDDKVLELVRSTIWERFCKEFPPGTCLPNYVRHIGIPIPIYIAIKQLWERFPASVWERFKTEFQGPEASKYIQLLRELIATGYKFSKTAGQDARKEQYQLAVTYLNAFAHGNQKLPKTKKGEWQN